MINPTLIPVKGGYKILISDGKNMKVFPKLYKTQKAANKRLEELNRHASSK